MVDDKKTKAILTKNVIDNEGEHMDIAMAFDLGTTNLKWMAVEERSGQRLGEGKESAQTQGTGPVSEQDPLAIAEMVELAIRRARSFGLVRKVSFSAAMHSFLVVDRAGMPLTKSWTWLDTRAAAFAAELRQSALSQSLRQQSGVPIHAMSPFVKWLFMKDQLPDGARPIALKDYLIYRLTGLWMTDFSTAAASGFLGVDNAWLHEALHLAQLDANELPALAEMTTRLSEKGGAFEVTLGGNDGATGHLHLGIPLDGSVGVLAMGTSGALRTTLSQPTANAELFCYTMGPHHGYLVGSAFSNVGNVFAWLARLFGVTVDSVVEEGLAAIRSNRSLPICLPFWNGERSPWWREDLTATWAQITAHHGRAELSGSALMAISALYRHGLQSLEQQDEPVKEIRAGSGLMEISSMAQWMADALVRDVVLSDDRDASLLGALELATHAVPSSGSYAIGPRYSPGDAKIGERVQETWEIMSQMTQESL